jgi:hypothetical protein
LTPWLGRDRCLPSIGRERAGGLASGGPCRIVLQGASGDLDSRSASTLRRRGGGMQPSGLDQLAATPRALCDDLAPGTAATRRNRQSSAGGSTRGRLCSRAKAADCVSGSSSRTRARFRGAAFSGRVVCSTRRQARIGRRVGMCLCSGITRWHELYGDVAGRVSKNPSSSPLLAGRVVAVRYGGLTCDPTRCVGGHAASISLRWETSMSRASRMCSRIRHRAGQDAWSRPQALRHSRRGPVVRRRVGAHNEEVYRDLLGLRPAELQRLSEEGVI